MNIISKIMDQNFLKLVEMKELSGRNNENEK